MPDSAEPLRRAIAALESQRALLGDAAAELALAPLREQLSRLEQPAQQLRQVSVLFVDVVGSTSITGRLDPEEASELMDGSLASFSRHVQAHGGQVLQYAGDSLLAAFGTPRVHEDDAVRAVIAALAVLADARARGEQVTRRWGHDGFGARAGIATGSVLLGGGVDGEGTIRGITVNLAARLEQAAPPGTLRICAATRRLVDGWFELEAAPPLAAKGIAEPVASWVVRGPAPDGTAHGRRPAAGTPLAGRGDELQRLADWRDAWLAGGGSTPAAALLVGEPGIGKSRLATEFRRRVGGRWLEAQAAERERGRAWGLLRQLLARPLGIRDTDRPADAAATWMRGVAPLLGREGDAAVLGQLLGLDFAAHPEVAALAADARQLAERGRHHATEMLRSLARQGGPLGLALEDLQWADAASLGFVDWLLDASVDLPVLLLASARPEFAGVPAMRRIELAPLPTHDAATLARALLAPLPEPPALLLQTLLLLTEGNPFFMEEWVRMLIDRGVLDATQPPWRFHPERLSQAALPSTLNGVLQARLDELPAAAARAVELAAVVGPVFWDDTLRELLDGAEPPLQPLLQRQLVVEATTSTLEGRREFRFRHPLLHQVCYERVLRRVRVPAHARVARWFESLPGERPMDRVAEHYERGQCPGQACAAWHAAAEAAWRRYANTEALAHVERARRLCDSGDLRRRHALALLAARVLGHLGEPERQADALQEAGALAQTLGDERSRCEVLDLRGRMLYARGEAAQALALSEQALALARQAAPDLAPRAGQAVLNALHLLGRGARARERAPALLALARAAGERAVEGAVLNLLGIIAHDEGDLGQAMAHYREALACHRASGHRSYEAGVLSNLGYAALSMGELAQAERSFQDAQALFAQIGEREKQGLVLVNLALTALHAGAPGLALGRTEEALALLRAARSGWGEAAALRVAGQARLASGEAPAAVDDLRRALAAFEALALAPLAMEARASLAWACWSAGERNSALADARVVAGAVTGGESLDGTEEPLRVLLDTWRVLQAAHDEQAPALLALARERLGLQLARLSDPAQRAHAALHAPHAAAIAAGDRPDLSCS